MAVNSWLLGGVISNDHITPEKRHCWIRPDLIDIPAMIQYSKYTDDSTQVHIFSNNIGCSIVLIPYAHFDSMADMMADYYSDEATLLQTGCCHHRKNLRHINPGSGLGNPDSGWRKRVQSELLLHPKNTKRNKRTGLPDRLQFYLFLRKNDLRLCVQPVQKAKIDEV